MPESVYIPAPSDFILDNFFIIDSDNFREISPKFLGFAIGDNKLAMGHAPNELIPADCAGFFINIVVHEGKILIQQDYFGAYGLYVFQSDHYFAVSNSCLLLARHLKNRFSLDLNQAFINFAASCHDYTSYCTESTYVSQIRQAPPHALFSISLDSGKLDISQLPYEAYYLKVDAKGAFTLLDEWHDKYHSLLKALTSAGNPVEMELSGGLDTRSTLATLFNATDLDLTRFTLSSVVSANPTYVEDFAIASQIASYYGLPLNQPLASHDSYNMDKADAFAAYFYPCFMYVLSNLVNNIWNIKPRFIFTGYGGEIIRQPWEAEYKDFLSQFLAFPDCEKYDFKAQTRKLFYEESKKPEAWFTYPMPMPDKLYLFTRLRYNCGRTGIAWFMHNQLMISPVMDPKLMRLQHSSTLLSPNLWPAIIQTRYMGKPEQFAIEGKRRIESDVWREARRLNGLFPYKPSHQREYELAIAQRMAPTKALDNKNDSAAIYINSLKGPELRAFIKANFGQDTYDYFYAQSSKIFTKRSWMLNALYELYLLCELLDKNRVTTYLPFAESANYKPNGVFSQIFSLFITANLIVRAISPYPCASPRLIHSEPNAFRHEKPHWLNAHNRRGFRLETTAIGRELAINIAITKACQLDFIFSCLPFKMGFQPVNILIDYTSIRIEEIAPDKNVASTPLYASETIVSVNASRPPHTVSLNIAKETTIALKFSFQPHDYDLGVFMKLFTALYGNFDGEIFMPRQT